MENKLKHNGFFFDELGDNFRNNHTKNKDINSINENNTYLKPKIIDSSKTSSIKKLHENNMKEIESTKMELLNKILNNNLNSNINYSSIENDEIKNQIKKLKKENDELKQMIEKREKLIDTIKNRCIENEKTKNELKAAIHNMKKYIKMHTSAILVDDKMEEEMAIKAVENQIISELSSHPDHISYEQLLKIKDDKKNLNTNVSEDKISSIPEVTYSTLYFGEIVQCMICMDEFKDNEKVKQIKCGHIFHKECLVQWLLNQKNCPICDKQF